MSRSRRGLGGDRRGSVTVEYALVSALLAILAIVGFWALGEGVGDLWRTLGQDAGAALSGG